jgi:hypothetical protein
MRETTFSAWQGEPSKWPDSTSGHTRLAEVATTRQLQRSVMKN